MKKPPLKPKLGYVPLLLLAIWLSPSAKSDNIERQLNLCLDVVSKRDKEVADLKILCDEKGKLGYQTEAQRDAAYKLAEQRAPILSYVLLGATIAGTGYVCAIGHNNDLCLITLGLSAGELGMLTIYRW